MFEKRDVIVRPSIWIIDRYYQCDGDTVPLDGIQVRWGRSSLFDKPQAASATIRLFDTTDLWLNFLKTGYCIGKNVFLQAGINQDGVEWEQLWTWFRGRITDVTISEGPHDPETNRVRGYVVEITAVDNTSQFSNIVIEQHELSLANNQSVLTRANWIAAQAFPISGVEAMYFEPAFQTKTCAETSVDNKSMQSIVDEFYSSMGTVGCYSPKDNSIRNSQKFYGTIATSFYRWSDGYLHIAPHPNPRPGAWGADTDEYFGTGLSGCRVYESGGTIGRHQENNLNRVQINYWNKATSQDETVTHQYTSVDTDGVRLFSLSSWLNTKSDVDGVASDLMTQIARPAAKTSHPNVTYDTFTSGGGFESVVQAMNLIMAGERQYLVYVSGSPWTVMTGVTPLFGVVGGTIRYEKQRWVVDCNLQPYYRSSPANPTVWDDMPESVGWGDSDVVDRLEHSIHWEDLRFVNDPTIRVYDDEFAND